MASARVKPRRVLFVTQSLAGGGAERSVVTILRFLDRSLFAPSLALLSQQGMHLGNLPTDVTPFDLGERCPYDWVRPTLRLRRLLRETAPSALVGVLRHPNLVALAAGVGFRPRVPTVVVEQGLLSHGLRSGRAYVLKRLLHQRLYPCASAVVAVSCGLASDVTAELRGMPPPVVIPNPCDTDQVRTLAAEEPDMLVDWTHPTFLAVARLEPVKRPELLLEAMARLDRALGCQLVVLGEGPLAGPLRARATALGLEGRVRWLGFRRNPFAYMARARALVLSSDHEAFANVLVEAMACGTPVISTDCPFGPREILAGGSCGLLVPPGDPGAMAATMTRLLGDAALATRLTRLGRSRAEEYGAPRVARLYEELLARVCGGSG